MGIYPLEYGAILLYALAVVRCFSYGVYALRRGNGAAFCAALILIGISGALFFVYLTQRL